MAAPQLVIDVINSNLFVAATELTSNITLSKLGEAFFKIRGGDIPFLQHNDPARLISGSRISFSADNINEYYNIFEQTSPDAQADQITTLLKEERVDDELRLSDRSSSDISLLGAKIERTWKYKGLLPAILQTEKVKSYLHHRSAVTRQISSNIDPKFTTEISHSDDFNKNIALVYLFTLWLREQQDALKIIDEISKELDKEDYSLFKLKALQAILDAQKSGKLTAEQLEELIKELQERISTARTLVSSSRFDKQRYLLQQISDLSNLSKRRFGHEQSQTSAPSIDPPDPNIYLRSVRNLWVNQDHIIRFTNSDRDPINKLTGASLGTELFKMSTEQLSKLVPKIKIFKTKYTKKMEVDHEVEFKFPTESAELGEIFNYDPNFPTKPNKESPKNFSKTKRGYGIQSFAWKYEGSDPFSVDRDISATLVLYFQDFSEFTALRGAGEKKYRYIDLIVPLEKDYDGLKGAAAKSFEQDIRIEAGWEIPNEFNKSLADAIRGSQVNFKLSLLDYSISFSDNGNGASTITINYTARIEAVGKNRLINVIAADKGEHENIVKLENLIRSKDTKDVSSRKANRAEQQKLFKTVREKASKRFINKLFDKKSIYWRKLDVESVLLSAVGPEAAKATYETLFPSNKWHPTYEDGLKETLDANPLDEETIARLLHDNFSNESTDASATILNPEKVIYTFFGDIIDTALSIALESGNFLGAPLDAIKNLKLGTLDFRVGESTYNLADLPIEMGVFTEFLQNKIGKRSEATKSIVSFISELLADVITNKIDTLLNLQDGTTRSFKIGYTELNKDLKQSTIHEYDLNKKRDIEEILRKPRSGDYLIIYSDSPLPSQFKINDGEYNTVKNKDQEAGLHHFALGSIHSLVKNISFDKIDLEYAREQRLSTNQEDPYALLKNVFNVNISMFGNNYFKPGSYIYVDPKVMGEMGNPYTKDSIANILGLGGYHIVTKVENSITSNSYSTTIDAVWETSGDGDFGLTQSNTKKKIKEKAKESEDAKTDSE